MNDVTIGTIRLTSQGSRFVWQACGDCGKERWVRILRGKPISSLCRLCHIHRVHGSWIPPHGEGENNNNWKGGRTTLAKLIRQSAKNKKLILRVLKRDKYTCRICGQVGGALEVDHIKQFSEILGEFLNKYAVLDVVAFKYELYLIALKYKPFWDKTNLRTLCRECHWKGKRRE